MSWTPDTIASHILFRPAQIRQAIIRLDDLQTKDESATRSTFIKNGRVWAANDAPRASRLASRFREYQAINANDSALAAFLIEKYRGQLCSMANTRDIGPRFAHLSEGLFIGRGVQADYW